MFLYFIKCLFELLTLSFKIIFAGRRTGEDLGRDGCIIEENVVSLQH